MFEQTKLLSDLGDLYTNRIVDRLNRFAFCPTEVLNRIASEALAQRWGNNNYVLKKYLAVSIFLGVLNKIDIPWVRTSFTSQLDTSKRDMERRSILFSPKTRMLAASRIA
jgi:hypothetical protein